MPWIASVSSPPLGQNLDPVAGRQDHALPELAIPAQSRKGGRDRFLAEGDPLSDLDGSRLVAQSDQDRMHFRGLCFVTGGARTGAGLQSSWRPER